MEVLLKRSILLLALLGTAACGGGGDTPDPTPVTDPTETRNGLPYAAGQVISDAEGLAMTLTSASYQTASGATIESPRTVTLDAGFFSTDQLNGSITIFGEVVQITNGQGTLANTNTVNVVYEPERSGDYVAAFEAVALDGNNYVGEEGYIVGFETRPSAVAAQTGGSVVYTGDFVANGLAARSEAEYEGGVVFTVNFNDNTVAGTFDGGLNGGAGSGGSDVDLAMGATSFSGNNNFNGSLTCADGCDGSAGTVDAAFYGPAADEIGGVIAVDFDGFEGAGTFIISVTP